MIRSIFSKKSKEKEKCCDIEIIEVEAEEIEDLKCC